MPTATARTSIPGAKYAATFAAWSLGLFALLRLGWIEAHGLLPLTRLQGEIAGRLGGLETLPVDVTLACSAADAMALCLGAVLAYPAAWRMRAWGIAGGLALILTLNTARIATLGRAVSSPAWFNLLHVYAWPALLLLAIAGYVFCWMRVADRVEAAGSAAVPARSRDTLVTWRLVGWTAFFLVVFAIASPWYLESAAVLATAAFMARAAASILRACGIDAIVAGNMLTTARGSVLVTQECIATPLIPVAIGAAFTFARTWSARAPWLLAIVPAFIALGIVRLLVVVLPPIVVASPLFLVHAFYQLLAAALVVFLVAAWRHGPGATAVKRTLAGYALAVLAVGVLGPIYTRGVMWGFVMPPNADPQGAIALLPSFQVGLFLALCAAVIRGVAWMPAVIGLVVLASWQIAGLAALQLTALHAGVMPGVTAIRALALATVLTAAMALPVLRAPSERVVGMEIVGRQPDPFVMMARFTQPLAFSTYSQPATDLPGALLTRAGGPVAGYDWLVLLSFPLAAATGYMLARHLQIPRAGSLFAALAFAFSPFHLAHAAYHPHVAQVQWIPLYLLAVWRCLDRATPSAAALLVVAISGVALSNFYGGLIAAVLTPVAVCFYWALTSRSHPSSARNLAITAGVLALCVLAGAAYVSRVAPDAMAHPAAFAFARADLFTHSARWWSYLVPPVAHPVLGDAARDLWQRAGVREGLVEQQVALGWAVIALGGVGMWGWFASRRRTAALGVVPILVLLALAALVCSLSPEGDIAGIHVVRPSALLYRLVPMFRSYARFGVVVQLMAALLAGIGVHYLWSAGTRRARVACVALVTLAAGEYAVWPPAMWRDVLPTTAHRWVVRQPGHVLALDCATRTADDELIPWLSGNRIALAGPSLDDCTEPHVAERLTAAGYTHLIVRRRSAEGRWFAAHPVVAGLEPAARFRDAEVRAVTSVLPLVYTVRMTGFHARERNAEWTWRWMDREASWTVENTSTERVEAAIDIDISAFYGPRRLAVLLDGRPVQTLVVDGGPAARRVGPLALSPGDHELAFRATEPTAAADTILHNGDQRAVSFAFGDWRWIVEEDR